MRERPKLGEVLQAEGRIDDFQLRAALGQQARWGHRLGEALVRMGFLSEDELVRTLARRFGIPGVNLGGKTIEPHVLDLVPVEVAEKYSCLPLFTKRERGVEFLYLGMDDPTNLTAIDDVSFRTGLSVRPVLIGPLELRDAIASYYRGEIHLLEHDRAIPEAPVPEGDTAPVLPDGAVAEEGGAPDEDLASLEPERTALDREAFGPPGTESKPREVPTRQILQAVTRLLIEKRIFTREELMESVRAIQSSEASDPGALDPSGG